MYVYLLGPGFSFSLTLPAVTRLQALAQASSAASTRLHIGILVDGCHHFVNPESLRLLELAFIHPCLYPGQQGATYGDSSVFSRLAHERWPDPNHNELARMKTCLYLSRNLGTRGILHRLFLRYLEMV